MLLETGEPPTGHLRLASARRRVRAFLDQLDQLEASNFPHPDAKEALEEIRRYFLARLRSLDPPASAPAGYVEEAVARVPEDIAKYTRVLGFILRSTNVRNPFELHFPIKRLVQKIIGEDTKLILSSEWEFVPFTYPMNLDVLPDFVLIGGPATESGNILIAPLAGHEIGHSVWFHFNIGSTIQPHLVSAIGRSLDQHADDSERLIKELDLGELGESWIQRECLSKGLLQLEEVFCDFLGIYIFGAAYLYAYEYFLAPGGFIRALDYPGDYDRLTNLLRAAERLELPVADGFKEGWTDSTYLAPPDFRLAHIVDDAVAAVVPTLLESSINFFENRDIAKPNPTVVGRVVDTFRRHEPDADGAMLSEVITAGWEVVRNAGGLSADADLDEYRMLGDLMLKSIEMSEVLDRMRRRA